MCGSSLTGSILCCSGLVEGSMFSGFDGRVAPRMSGQARLDALTCEA